MTLATRTGQGGRCVMTTDPISTDPVAGRRSPSSGEIGGAAIHPRFLRSGPWALSVVAALLFGLSFATSYAALYDYSLELQFPREFAIAFPLVLDAVIVVLAVTLLLERALGRRTMTIKGRQFTLRVPSWPLLALWGYFAGSVAGNVGHAPPLLAAQLVATVPPVSAVLTFHLLLRLLDRAPSLRAIAEAYEERSVEERERAAARKSRRDRTKTGPMQPRQTVPERSSGLSSRIGSDGARDDQPLRHALPVGARALPDNGHSTYASTRMSATEMEELRRRVQAAIKSGERVTGDMVGRWLGVSPRTGRRRLAALLDDDLSLQDSSTD